MKTIRKFVLLVSFAVVALINGCNPALAADASYVFKLEDGVVLFNATPCTNEPVLARVKPEFKASMKSGVVIADDKSQARIFMCWIEDGSELASVAIEGSVARFPLDNPRMKKRATK